MSLNEAPIFLDQTTGTSYFRAKLQSFDRSAGLVRLRLVNERGEPVYVEISPEQFDALDIDLHDEVYLTSDTQTVFVEDFMI